MTAEDIRRLDGPALSRLAYDLGLAPEDASLWPGPDGHEYPYANRAFWEPHADLPAADTLFRGLRAQGWDTHVQYFATTGTGQIGAWKTGTGQRLAGALLQWPTAENPTEALALVRVGVLAVASTREGL